MTNPNLESFASRIIQAKQTLELGWLYHRRQKYEERLIHKDVQPLFRVSWEKLKGLAELSPQHFRRMWRRLRATCEKNTEKAATIWQPHMMPPPA